MKGSLKIRNGGITANVKRDKLYIYYEDDTLKEKTICKYEKNNNDEILSCKYDAKNITGVLIARGIIDAIFKMNGYDTSIFKKYDINQFIKLKLEDGIEYKLSQENTLKININTKVYEKLDELGLNPIDVPEITEENISNIFKELEEKNKYIITKNTKTIYVISNETNYTIYTQDTNADDKENYHKSIMTVIYKLNPDVYSSINSTTEKLNVESSNDLYEIKHNVDNTNMTNIFKTKENITQIIFNKPIKNQEEQES